MSHSLPHLTLTTCTSSLSPMSSTSPIFPTVSPSQTSPMILNPHIPCDVPRQSGGSTQIPSLTSTPTLSTKMFSMPIFRFLRIGMLAGGSGAPPPAVVLLQIVLFDQGSRSVMAGACSLFGSSARRPTIVLSL